MSVIQELESAIAIECEAVASNEREFEIHRVHVRILAEALGSARHWGATLDRALDTGGTAVTGVRIGLLLARAINTGSTS